MNRLCLFFLIFMSCLCADEVLVVYNSDVAAGKELAEGYVKLYDLPAEESLMGVKFPTKETISMEEYLAIFEAQILGRFQENRPSVILTVYGVPLWVKDGERLRSLDQLLVLGEGAQGLDERLIFNPLMESPIPPFANKMVMVSRLDGPSAKQAKVMLAQWKRHRQVGCWRRYGLSSVDDELEQLMRQKGLWVEEKPALNVIPLGELQFLHAHQGKIKELRDYHKQEMLSPGAMLFRYHSSSFKDGDFRSLGRGDASAACMMGVSFYVGAQKTEQPEEDLFDPLLFFLSYAEGENFIRSAYNAMPNLGGSLLVLGDPLANPFSKEGEALQTEYFGQEQLEDPSDHELHLYNQAKDWWLIKDYYRLWNKGYAKIVVANLKMAIQNRKSSIFFEHLARSYDQIGEQEKMDPWLARWPEKMRTPWDQHILEVMGY